MLVSNFSTAVFNVITVQNIFCNITQLYKKLFYHTSLSCRKQLVSILMTKSSPGKLLSFPSPCYTHLSTVHNYRRRFTPNASIMTDISEESGAWLCYYYISCLYLKICSTNLHVSGWEHAFFFTFNISYNNLLCGSCPCCLHEESKKILAESRNSCWCVFMSECGCTRFPCQLRYTRKFWKMAVATITRWMMRNYYRRAGKCLEFQLLFSISSATGKKKPSLEGNDKYVRYYITRNFPLLTANDFLLFLQKKIHTIISLQQVKLNRVHSWYPLFINKTI